MHWHTYTYLLMAIILVVPIAGCTDNTPQEKDEPTGTINAQARSDVSVAYIKDGVTPTIKFYGDWSNGTDLEYTWDFGDGSKGSGPIVEHTYSQVGRYMVVLVVEDRWGRTDSDTIYVSIGLQKSISASLPVFQTVQYTVPVELYAQRIRVTLQYPSGNVINGQPTNEVIMSVDDTGGQVHYDTKDDQPDSGTWQKREIVVANQDIIAAQYADFIITLQYQKGTQPISYELEYTVSY